MLSRFKSSKFFLFLYIIHSLYNSVTCCETLHPLVFHGKKPEVTPGYLVTFDIHYSINVNDSKPHHLIMDCSGTIIKPNWIISAAQCFVPYIFSILIYHDDKEIGEADKFIKHPNYKYKHDENVFKTCSQSDIDIALVKTADKLFFYEHVHHIEMIRKNPRVKEVATIIGYGESQYKKYFLSTVARMIIAKCPSEGSLCTYPYIRAAPAIGDVGGPLIYHEKLAGVISCTCKDNKAGISSCLTRYSSIAKHYQWIMKTISEDYD